MRSLAIILLPLALASLSCSSSSTSTPVPPSTSSIGAAGGTITASDGSGVTIPAGALAATVAITLAASTQSPPSGVTSVGQMYTFGPEGQTFTAPVTVTLEFDSISFPAGKSAQNVVIYTAPLGSTSFTALPTTVVDLTHVSAQTTHFSNFFPGVGASCATNQDCASGSVCIEQSCSL